MATAKDILGSLHNPLRIKLMMACYYAAEPHNEVGYATWNSSAGKAEREWLLENDLVTEYWQPTERGYAWLRAILDVDPPPQAEQG